MLFTKVLMSLLLLLYEVQCYNYSIPEPEIEVFVPKGFRISIEDMQGITQVNYRVNITRQIPHIELGTFRMKINHKTAGRWVFTRRNVRLKVGDIITYDVFVTVDNIGFRKIGKPFVVTELITFYKLRNKKGKPSTAKPTTVQPSTRPTVSIKNMLELCKRISLNATQTIMRLESEIEKLQKENEQLMQTMSNHSDAKKLTLAGRIPPDDDALYTVKFILWEKLDLKPTIKSAQKNPDHSITFELATLTEKLEILENAKEKLKHSRIFIF